LYELAARALVSSIQQNILVNIHMLQSLPSEFIVEDILFRVSLAECIKFMKMEDLTALQETLNSANEHLAWDLLRLIISCKGKPKLSSFHEIQKLAPKWICDLVYQHINGNIYKFEDSLECVKIILVQEGLSRAMQFAKKFSENINYIKMVKEIISELRLEHLSEKEVDEVMRMVEESLWVPYQVRIKYAKQLLPIFGFWDAIFRSEADPFDLTSDIELQLRNDTEAILNSIGHVHPTISNYLADLKTNYQQLLQMVNALATNQKTYQKLTDLLKKLKPHFFASARQVEWEELLKWIRDKHKQKKNYKV